MDNHTGSDSVGVVYVNVIIPEVRLSQMTKYVWIELVLMATLVHRAQVYFGWC